MDYTSDQEARKAGFCNAACRNGYTADRRIGLIYSAGQGFQTWRETARAWNECAYCRADLPRLSPWMRKAAARTLPVKVLA